MENKETMNLQQKLIAISNEMPKLLKKHYSDEVDYDFVKIDDIFELLNPAFTKHHICLQELEETDAACDYVLKHITERTGCSVPVQKEPLPVLLCTLWLKWQKRML